MKKNPCILILDDEAKICQMLADFLGRFDYCVESFQEPFPALMALGKKEYSCVVVDFSVTSPEGESLLALLEKRSLDAVALDFPPYIVISGRSFRMVPEVAQRFLEKAHCVLQKPFDLEDLKSKIDEVIT